MKFNEAYFKKFIAKNWWQKNIFEWIDRKGPVWWWIRNNLKRNDSVLDYGCGPGWFVKHLSDSYRTFGVDISKDAILMAQKQVPNADFRIGSLESIKFESKLNLITCFDVLEHIEKSFHIMYYQAFRRNLVDSGYLIISVPITDSLMREYKADLWWANEDESHVCLQSRNDWMKEFVENGFELLLIYSSGFINHPLKKYKLTGWHWWLHAITQAWGMVGGPLAAQYSDVDFYILRKV